MQAQPLLERWGATQQNCATNNISPVSSRHDLCSSVGKLPGVYQERQFGLLNYSNPKLKHKFTGI